MGATCLTNLTVACCGVQTRSATSATCLPIAFSIMAAKSAASPDGSGTMSTVPSSAVEIVRSSLTSQSVPTPRQSQLKTPSHWRIAAASCSGVSCWFLPSVSKIACRSSAGYRPKVCRASSSHWPMAVPPLARRPVTACLAAALEEASARAMPPSAGNTGQARLVPAITANKTPSRTTSTAAAVAARASAILVCGYSIDPEQSMMMISALLAAAPPGPPPGRAATPGPEATVTMALTSRPPSGRYWFWSTSTVKPESVMAEFSSLTSPACGRERSWAGSAAAGRAPAAR